MRAFYSLLTVAADFDHLKTYDDIDGRQVSLIVSRVGVPSITAIDEAESNGAGTPGHEILAVLNLAAHDIHDETQYSKSDYWQSEHFHFEGMENVMLASLLAHFKVQLLEGEELEAVKAEEKRRFQALIEEVMIQHADTLEALSGVNESPEEQMSRLQLYKIMRQEPPEEITK